MHIGIYNTCTLVHFMTMTMYTDIPCQRFFKIWSIFPTAVQYLQYGMQMSIVLSLICPMKNIILQTSFINDYQIISGGWVDTDLLFEYYVSNSITVSRFAS